MESIGHLFSGKAVPQEPPGIRAIKAYVQAQFDREVSVAAQDGGLVVVAGNASLANALRLRLHELRQLGGTDKVTVRIGRLA